MVSRIELIMCQSERWHGKGNLRVCNSESNGTFSFSPGISYDLFITPKIGSISSDNIDFAFGNEIWKSNSVSRSTNCTTGIWIGDTSSAVSE